MLLYDWVAVPLRILGTVLCRQAVLPGLDPRWLKVRPVGSLRPGRLSPGCRAGVPCTPPGY
jgi:hypothetical protein